MDYAHQASLSSTISQSLLKFISIELVMLSNHHPLYARRKANRIYHETVTPCFNLVRNILPSLLYRRITWLIELSRDSNR